MKKLILTVVGILIFSMLTGCGTKRYVGERVNYSGPYWCSYSEYSNNGEKSCKIEQGVMIFSFDIKKQEDTENYIIEGTIDLSKGAVKSFDRIDNAKTRFFMLVAKDGYITDNVGFRPHYFDGINNEIPFRIVYESSAGISAITFGYFLTVVG